MANRKLSADVTKLLDLYRELWLARYGTAVSTTGRDRSKLAEVVEQVGDVDVLANALRAYLADDWNEKLGHTMLRFCNTTGEWIAKSKRRSNGTQATIARHGDAEFEGEVDQWLKNQG